MFSEHALRRFTARAPRRVGHVHHPPLTSRKRATHAHHPRSEKCFEVPRRAANICKIHVFLPRADALQSLRATSCPGVVHVHLPISKTISKAKNNERIENCSQDSPNKQRSFPKTTTNDCHETSMIRQVRTLKIRFINIFKIRRPLFRGAPRLRR